MSSGAGLDALYLYPKTQITTFAIRPQKFYSESRKLTTLDIETDLSYEYVVDYDINQLLNLESKPCREELSWREDACKMTQVTPQVDNTII